MVAAHTLALLIHVVRHCRGSPRSCRRGPAPEKHASVRTRAKPLRPTSANASMGLTTRQRWRRSSVPAARTLAHRHVQARTCARDHGSVYLREHTCARTHTCARAHLGPHARASFPACARPRAI
eukprot:5787984-Pleurochrysis_carterae.AAC.7